jgi:hypothetical protein
MNTLKKIIAGTLLVGAAVFAGDKILNSEWSSNAKNFGVGFTGGLAGCLIYSVIHSKKSEKDPTDHYVWSEEDSKFYFD